jgi:hypothetical protein
VEPSSGPSTASLAVLARPRAEISTQCSEGRFRGGAQFAFAVRHTLTDQPASQPKTVAGHVPAGHFGMPVGIAETFERTSRRPMGLGSRRTISSLCVAPESLENLIPCQALRKFSWSLALSLKETHGRGRSGRAGSILRWSTTNGAKTSVVFRCQAAAVRSVSGWCGQAVCSS